ncbi:antitoxin MazE-like protein [Bartonella callosciuri]|nr:antitoxin MazE-like protein [Bartonella callosciuri]
MQIWGLATHQLNFAEECHCQCRLVAKWIKLKHLCNCLWINL